ncbi:hypothetical protein TNCV_3291411 [Trichonephila clavipes]|nr:hypothetical protein TNCV_3291411 [Trichonephila clavipes]
MGLVPKMPVFLDKQAHLLTEDANETRSVTSVSWVVEAVNGQLKKWRALSNIIPKCVQMPYIVDYVKIVSVQFLTLSTLQDLTILRTTM